MKKEKEERKMHAERIEVVKEKIKGYNEVVKAARAVAPCIKAVCDKYTGKKIIKAGGGYYKRFREEIYTCLKKITASKTIVAYLDSPFGFSGGTSVRITIRYCGQVGSHAIYIDDSFVVADVAYGRLVVPHDIADGLELLDADAVIDAISDYERFLDEVEAKDREFYSKIPYIVRDEVRNISIRY
jgi:hypothetical protein